jgi:hypothetical protein
LRSLAWKSMSCKRGRGFDGLNIRLIGGYGSVRMNVPVQKHSRSN